MDLGKLVDVHAHLYVSEAFPSLDVIKMELMKARNVGIVKICVVGENLQEAKMILEMSKMMEDEIWRMILPCAGLHPVQNGKSVKEENLEEMLQWIRREKDSLVCIGEIGLDFSLHVLSQDEEESKREKEIQMKVFEAQLRLAEELGLPVNVHSRSAGHYALECLEKFKGAAICHAFDGKVGYALDAIKKKQNLYFSIPPSIVRSPQKQKLVERLPLERLLLETDSPALSPEKDGLNVPSNLVVSLGEIARIKGKGVEEVREVIWETSERLAKKKLSEVKTENKSSQ